MDAQRLWAETKLALRRLVRSDLQREPATDREREQLAAAPDPIHAPQAQDYAAWRRSLLWVAGAALVVLVLIELVTYQSTDSALREAQQDQLRNALGAEAMDTLDGIRWMMILATTVGAVLTVLAAVRWRTPKRSRRAARYGFLIMFATPFLLALIPFTEMVSLQHLQGSDRQVVRQMLGGLVGAYYFFLIGPRAIALFPGIIRSSVTIKTILPESPMPGWTASLVAPLYSIFLLVVFSAVNQSQGNMLLLAGIACLMIAPLVYVFRGSALLRPLRQEEVSKAVGVIRRRSVIFASLGALFLAIFFIDAAFFSFDDFLKFFISILGNVVLLTVVGADFLLAVIRVGHEQSKALLESKQEATLEGRLEALSEVGFMDLSTREPTADEPRNEGS